MENQEKTQIEKLCFGDLVRVYWLDASEAMGRTGEGGEPHFDTPVASIGHFVGVKGKRAKHLILLKDIFQITEKTYDLVYNCIPVGMIEKVNVRRKDDLENEYHEIIKKNLMRIKTKRGTFVKVKCRWKK
ncbi:MAG: hypothetical protein WC325_00775 [Candidatus Bathyarchaeia archaeon]|jgi:hypothetical protein